MPIVGRSCIDYNHIIVVSMISWNFRKGAIEKVRSTSFKQHTLNALDREGNVDTLHVVTQMDNITGSIQEGTVVELSNFQNLLVIYYSKGE